MIKQIGPLDIELMIHPVFHDAGSIIPIHISIGRIINIQNSRFHTGIDITLMNVGLSIWYTGKRNYYEHDND